MLHGSEGMGRNAWGKKKINDAAEDEISRCMGHLPKASRENLVRAWDTKLKYKVNVLPVPTTSELFYFPEAGLSYKLLREFINYERDSRTAFFKEKKGKSDYTIQKKPSYIPTSEAATILLVNTTGSNAGKRCNIVEVFPSVNLAYLREINAELLKGNIEGLLLRMGIAITGPPNAKKPSKSHAYALWTYVFTKTLRRESLSLAPIYQNLSAFFRKFSTDQLLIGEMKGKKRGRPEAMFYLSILKRFKKLQAIITEKRGSKMPENAGEVIGEAYSALGDISKSKLDSFMKASWEDSPNYCEFLKGAYVGILLNSLSYTLKKEGRRFSPTGGRHPSLLRGDAITSILSKGIGLLQNLGKASHFDNKTLPFIHQFAVSHKNNTDFNNGLTLGLSYFDSKEED